MACFLLPMTLCDKIEAFSGPILVEKIMAKRVCTGVNGGKLYVSKDEGSLRFRNFTKFNITLLAKKGWRILTNLSSLLA